MHHQHRSRQSIGQRPDLQIPGTPSEFYQDGILPVGHGQERLALSEQPAASLVKTVQSQYLDLSHHLGSGGLRLEASPLANKLGRVAGRGDHRGLLDDHRDQTVSAVDQEIHRYPQRHAKHAYHVLAHPVCLVRGEPHGSGERGRFPVSQSGSFLHLAQALGRAQFVEPRDPRNDAAIHLA